MDVSAPRPLQQSVAVEAGQLPVRPAPMATSSKASEQQRTEVAPKTKSVNQSHEAVQSRTGAPVGVITVAVLAMMLLSAAAVVVYATSQTA